LKIYNVQTIIENLRNSGGRCGKTVANNSISKATKIEMLTQCNPLPVNIKFTKYLEFNTNYNKYLVEQKPKQEYI
jgi:hypothetical protein